MFSSIQHASTTLSSINGRVISARAVAVYSESAVVIDACLCQWQSTEEYAMECWSQSLFCRNTEVAT